MSNVDFRYYAAPDNLNSKLEFASEGAACFDIKFWNEAASEDTIILSPGQTKHFRTGLYFEVPLGYGLFVFSRSGHGFKHSVRLSNCVGVIDSDYRGELVIALHNDSETSTLVIEKGNRIAQAALFKLPSINFVPVSSKEELSRTERGEGGFGSTGA